MVVDMEICKVFYSEKFVGFNIGYFVFLYDGLRVWFFWVVYCCNLIMVGNI